VEEIVSALTEQQAELDGLVAGLDDAGWATPAPACPGWTVADVVLHLAQTDEFGTASAQHRTREFSAAAVSQAVAGGEPRASSGSAVDDFAGIMVERERDVPPSEVLARWRQAASAQRNALLACDPHERLVWVAGEVAARTLATTRLAETWIHTTDIAGALGTSVAPTERLKHIARLAWRTLPYAYARAGATLQGGVAIRLTGTDGQPWVFEPDGEPVTQVTGSAADFCLVAGRRLDPAHAALRATGADASTVLHYVRTYA